MENIRQVCKELGRKWVQRFLDRKVYLLLSSAFGFFGAWKIVWIMVTFLMSSTKMVQLLFLANLSFAFGLVSLMGYVFHRWNRDWDLYSNRFFAEWVRKQRIIRTVTGVVGGVLLVLAIVNLRYWIEHWERNNVTYRYLPLIALAFQWIVCRGFQQIYMEQKLRRSMGNMQLRNQKNLETALRSEQMKVDLISNVSHDLKTPLTSIVGYLELMKKEELDDVVSDYVEVISQKSQKLKEMIDSLFDLAKTSSGNVELKMEVLELNRLVEQVEADMADVIEDSGREMVPMLAKLPTDFVADSSYMYRIVQNLLENALKYSQEQTRIFLKTSIVKSEEGMMVRLEITNTANYRMEFSKEQIVERFVRGDKSRTTEGNGLGLAIVNTYTAALGGRFDVQVDCDQFKAVVEFPNECKIMGRTTAEEGE
ncbi:HAMP domain-containing sensor histidine kinase [Lachnospiraceae bacterium 29-84]